MLIAVDFDGTIVEHRYPDIGPEIPFAIDTLKRLREERHRLILWTVRKGRLLDEAVRFCRERGLEFYAVNSNYPEENSRCEGYSRKLGVDLFIDDRNLGGLPDWGVIYRMVHDGLTFEDLYAANPRQEPAFSSGKQMKNNLIHRIMNLKKLFGVFALLALLTSCASYRKALYLRDDEVLEMVEQRGSLYEYRVMPKDELTITVSTSDPEVSAPFYRKIGQSKLQNNNMNQGMTNAKLLDYLVDNEGYIDFPILGKLHVVGLTSRQCEDLIRQRLQPYLNETPNVTVRILSYTISVLGEVNRPGTYTVTDERITIFEALAQAGDMTLFARRNDVELLREDSLGRRTVAHLDLTAADIALSPYYYLQQNDVIYVKPTKAKVRSNTLSSNSSFWISLTSLAATIASLVIIALR